MEKEETNEHSKGIKIYKVRHSQFLLYVVLMLYKIAVGTECEILNPKVLRGNTGIRFP